MGRSRHILLRILIDWMLKEPSRTALISTENFVHPWSLDPSIIAERIADIMPQAHILMVIREQVSMLTSFYRWHGGFGQYLFLNKYVDEPCYFRLARMNGCISRTGLQAAMFSACSTMTEPSLISRTCSAAPMFMCSPMKLWPRTSQPLQQPSADILGLDRRTVPDASPPAIE